MRAPADNLTPPLSASPGGLRQFLRTTLGSALLSAVICAALWIAISYATGGAALFSLGGGILIGVVVFIIGYGVRLIFDRRTSLI
jgi:ABC-type transport system involved in cytochrome bd biosynthesis fused ATPase/permease subunit